MFSAHRLIMRYIRTKFCQSISKGFKIKDPNSQVHSRVVANVDGCMYVRTDKWMETLIPILHDPYIALCLRQARQKGMSKFVKLPKNGTVCCCKVEMHPIYAD